MPMGETIKKCTRCYSAPLLPSTYGPGTNSNSWDRAYTTDLVLRDVDLFDFKPLPGCHRQLKEKPFILRTSRGHCEMRYHHYSSDLPLKDQKSVLSNEAQQLLGLLNSQYDVCVIPSFFCTNHGLLLDEPQMMASNRPSNASVQFTTRGQRLSGTKREVFEHQQDMNVKLKVSSKRLRVVRQILKRVLVLFGLPPELDIETFNARQQNSGSQAHAPACTCSHLPRQKQDIGSRSCAKRRATGESSAQMTSQQTPAQQLESTSKHLSCQLGSCCPIPSNCELYVSTNIKCICSRDCKTCHSTTGISSTEVEASRSDTWRASVSEAESEQSSILSAPPMNQGRELAFMEPGTNVATRRHGRTHLFNASNEGRRRSPFNGTDPHIG